MTQRKGQTTDRWSSRSVDANQVHGFDTELIYLENMLQQRQSFDEFKAVGMVGKRGVGKTFPGFGFACPRSPMKRKTKRKKLLVEC